MKRRFAPLAWLASLMLCGCIGNSGNPADPPTNVQAYAGDGAISLTWDANPSVEYWVFFAQDPTLSTNNWTNLLSAGAVVNTSPPMTLCNLINNPYPTSLYPDYFFTINGRTGTAPGGSGSPLVSTSPRQAGGPIAPWVTGPSIPAPMTGLGYVPLTPCGYAGRPPSGIFVAVGPSGAVYSSTVAPTVAGPLVPSQGNNLVSWIPGNVPAGFNQNLTGVAAYAGPTNPAAPNIIFVAVGENGSILRSSDGKNWVQVAGVPTANNLNAVAFSGTNFVVVGDGGIILISNNGLNWSVSPTSTLSSNNLHAVACNGGYCVAVGDAGTTLWSFNSGGSWSLYPHALNNWIGVAYGNNDANADPPVVTQTDVTLYINIPAKYINTWVIVDAQGNYAYATTTGGWIDGNTPIASSVSAIGYITRFIALDNAGNVYASEKASAWTQVGASGLATPTAISSNTQGFVALSASGANASSF